jgi:ATP-binding cassette subfamily B protein
MTTLSAEFTLPRRLNTDRRGPLRWIFSHALHHWYLFVSMMVGAVSNAALAALVPVFIGQAFNSVRDNPGDTASLLHIAFLIAISQSLRGVLQLARNFSAELVGQRLERDIRDELYVSLLGKSMTYHSLQPVGDTMARATNDVREINLMFSPGINLVIGSANFLIMPILFAPSYNPALIITPLLFMIGYFLSLWQYLHELGPITNRVRQTFGDLNTRLTEAIDGIETVKGMAQEDSEDSKITLAITGRPSYARVM